MKEHDLVLLGNHGCVAVGQTLEDAVKIIEAAEEVLKIAKIAGEVGTVADIPDDKLESLFEHHPGSKRNRNKKKEEILK